ncbi:helix-turn-helix transcriptional regulator [Rubellimicrobium mesophilum]|nr:WYL domain-containing protein [Rubellimicrobium mesophilum]
MSDDARHLGVARHLELALRLAGCAEGLTVAEMAAEMGVVVRTVQRMRAALETVFPMDVLFDGSRRRYRIVGGLSPNMVAPLAEELAELALAKTALESAGEAVRSERLAALELKILAAIRAAARARIEPDLEALKAAQLPVAVAGPQQRLAAGILESCQTALQAGSVLAFDYAAAGAVPQRREVAPRGLLFGARSYLVGALNDWGAPALWRLDRMSSPEVLARAAWPDPAFDLRDYASRSFGLFQEKPRDIVLRFDAPVAQEAARFIFHPQQKVRELPDGRLEVAFRAGGLLELARHVFTWSGAVEIVEPPELRDILRRELAANLARLDPAQSTCHPASAAADQSAKVSTPVASSEMEVSGSEAMARG